MGGGCKFLSCLNLWNPKVIESDWQLPTHMNCWSSMGIRKYWMGGVRWVGFAFFWTCVYNYNNREAAGSNIAIITSAVRTVY